MHTITYLLSVSSHLVISIYTHAGVTLGLTPVFVCLLSCVCQQWISMAVPNLTQKPMQLPLLVRQVLYVIGLLPIIPHL